MYIWSSFCLYKVCVYSTTKIFGLVALVIFSNPSVIFTMWRGVRVRDCFLLIEGIGENEEKWREQESRRKERRNSLCTLEWNSLIKKLGPGLHCFLSPTYFMSNQLPYFSWELPCCLCILYMHRIRSGFNKRHFHFEINVKVKIVHKSDWQSSLFHPHWCCQVHDQNFSIFFFDTC